MKEALELPQAERARLAAELLASLEPDVPGEQRGAEEWIAELERRARAAIDGDPGVTWTDARRQIQDRLSDT